MNLIGYKKFKTGYKKSQNGNKNPRLATKNACAKYWVGYFLQESRMAEEERFGPAFHDGEELLLPSTWCLEKCFSIEEDQADCDVARRETIPLSINPNSARTRLAIHLDAATPMIAVAIPLPNPLGFPQIVLQPRSPPSLSQHPLQMPHYSSQTVATDDPFGDNRNDTSSTRNRRSLAIPDARICVRRRECSMGFYGPVARQQHRIIRQWFVLRCCRCRI